MIKLTKDEVELLLHRLTIPECIAEALCDRADDELPAPWTRDEVVAAAVRMERRAQNFGVVDLDTDLDREVLEDAVDGSTALYGDKDAYDNGQIDKAELDRRIRVARALERKLFLAGIPVRFPQ